LTKDSTPNNLSQESQALITRQEEALLETAEQLSIGELAEAARDIASRFSLQETSIKENEEAQDWLAQLRVALRAQISKMLERRPEALMQLLYRIDVNEQKVKAAVAAIPGIDLPSTLTELIIERQLQKMLLRRRAQAFLLPDE
jgi:hypothetical protein